MLYHVRRFPAPNTVEQQGVALARLVQHAGSLTIHAVRVGDQAGLYLVVPDAVSALVELRVLPALVEMEGCLERRRGWAQRPEWAIHALLVPTTDAQPLDITLLDNSASACLTQTWTRRGVAAHLFASSDDKLLLDQISQRGWRTQVVSASLTGRLTTALHRPRRTGLRPILSQRPPASPAEAARITSLITSQQPSACEPPTRPSFLASAGAPGLLLGTNQQGAAVTLAFRPQLMAVDAPQEDMETLSLTLLQRALGLHAGVVAILPPASVAALRLSPLHERLRVLDACDPYQSTAIPWRSLTPQALHAALTTVSTVDRRQPLSGLPIADSLLNPKGIAPRLDHENAASFAALLERYGVAHLATDAVRSLTASPGDDLRGVVAAGGGVVLTDNVAADGRLLAALLLHLLATPPALARPVVLLRPPHVAVPSALAAQALDVVLGATEPAHSTLARTAAGWRLTSADNSWQQLLTSLAHTAPLPDAASHSALLQGLAGAAHTPEPAPLLAADNWHTMGEQHASAETFDWHMLAQDLHGTLAAEPQPFTTNSIAALAEGQHGSEDRNAVATGATDNEPAPTPSLLSELQAYVRQTINMDRSAATTGIVFGKSDEQTDALYSAALLLDCEHAPSIGTASAGSLRLGGRRRAIWRPRTDGASRVPPSQQMHGLHSAPPPEQNDQAIALDTSKPIDADIAHGVHTIDASTAIPADPSPLVTNQVDTTSYQSQATQAIDLGLVAELIQQNWQQGTRLPALIALIAPHYPHVAPQALRRAIRQLIADQFNSAAVSSPSTPTASIDNSPAPLVSPAASMDTSASADQPYAAAHPPIPLATEDEVDLLTPAQAARELGVHVKTIQRWDQDGKIAVIRNNANHRRIPIAEVERLRREMRDRRQEPTERRVLSSVWQ